MKGLGKLKYLLRNWGGQFKARHLDLLEKVLKGKDQDLKLLLERVLKSADYGGFQAECLTDTWIGKDRWAFIDLSAGPFSWGPAVGGEGVRTEASLPNVERTIGSTSGSNDVFDFGWVHAGLIYSGSVILDNQSY
ncbi:hypothetical protein L195_g001717 [Trifolium pratense]|uniref:DUF7906 domain-containing protein n=1 Tax=Trifolium pratense TaxID=57577 RepID=A0A2K3NQF8_TRIPR|nr:hypothetical protein L195_g001717 [Trifolium pratense]